MANQNIEARVGNPTLSRRDLLRAGAFGAVAFALAACEVSNGGQTRATASPSGSLVPGASGPAFGEGAGATITPLKDRDFAQRQGDHWVLQDPDGNPVDHNFVSGFYPEKDLIVATDVNLHRIDISHLDKYADWEKALNTGRPVGDRLSGYNYDYNDFCPTEDFECNVQGDMWAWRVFQGQEVQIPELGKLVGSEGKSVVALFINLEPDVVAWDNEELGQVKVKRGFTATGRMFDGDKWIEMEEQLAGHWLHRQKNGTPEKSYVGITDDPDNAKGALFVTFVYRQWGNNEDGTPRRQFQLVRAQNYSFDKGSK